MVWRVFLLTAFIRTFSLFFLLTININPFDNSAQIKHHQHQQLNRWDTLHFINPSNSEQNWAFAPGITTLLWLTNNSIIITSIISTIASITSTVILFLYSTLVSLLHAFSPSPSTQVVPYTEPFYALFSFAAIYLQTQHVKQSYMRKLSSAMLMALATSFRPIGIIQALQWLPDWCHQLEKLVLKSPSKRNITLSAFLVHSFQTFILACRNNGFLKYWTWNQAPLFLLSLPVYMASFGGIWTYYHSRFTLDDTPSSQSREVGGKSRPFLDRRLAIHVHIQLVITVILLFFSHVQIILRQAATVPSLWWGLADGIQRHWHHNNNTTSPHPSYSRVGYWAYWFPWIVLWAPLSLLLWAGFYPPA
ncbi:hypothetical protein VP01_1650g8 [Puccinia sorghi]|uniref:GPI mannosyltransferase 2 n=1 Tax=Puccinia sorghi TaxID=27349 RepID=A0A0L6VGM3_9BASI|nr:hypothetical protein VP01_1650g8 [Puccinia sorghi]